MAVSIEVIPDAVFCEGLSVKEYLFRFLFDPEMILNLGMALIFDDSSEK